jgi:DNA helicase-2/ATP-dependent DNA helicase PcrA
MGSGVQVGEQLFKIGQTVQHSRFGQGVIMQLQGQGTDATARVYFSDHGEKTLALGVAKLEIIK